jgi:FixJ family two-component response regulator
MSWSALLTYALQALMTNPSCVAVIEDDTDARVSLGRVLRAGGFDARCYASAEDFLSSGALEPLCLLLDMQLEGMSGLELLRGLRSEGSSLPVIVLTASDDPDSRSEAERLGCVAYFLKPFQGRTLVTLVRGLASERQQTQGASK